MQLSFEVYWRYLILQSYKESSGHQGLKRATQTSAVMGIHVVVLLVVQGSGVKDFACRVQGLGETCRHFCYLTPKYRKKNQSLNHKPKRAEP